MSEAPDQAPPWTTQRIKDAIEDCEVGLKMHAPPDAILAAADLLALLRMIPEPAASPPAASQGTPTDTQWDDVLRACAQSIWDMLKVKRDNGDGDGITPVCDILDELRDYLPSPSPEGLKADLDHLEERHDAHCRFVRILAEKVDRIALAIPGPLWILANEPSPEPAAGSSSEATDAARPQTFSGDRLATIPDRTSGARGSDSGLAEQNLTGTTESDALLKSASWLGESVAAAPASGVTGDVFYCPLPTTVPPQAALARQQAQAKNAASITCLPCILCGIALHPEHIDSIPSSKVDRVGWSGGVAGQIVGGYGSTKFDTIGVAVAACDCCLERAIAAGRAVKVYDGLGEGYLSEFARQNNKPCPTKECVYVNGHSGPCQTAGDEREPEVCVPAVPAPSQTLDLAQFDGATPGPWVAGGTGVYDSDGENIATAIFSRLPSGAGRTNARLIAAAPSILALAKSQAAKIEELNKRIEELTTSPRCIIGIPGGGQIEIHSDISLGDANAIRKALSDGWSGGVAPVAESKDWVQKCELEIAEAVNGLIVRVQCDSSYGGALALGYIADIIRRHAPAAGPMPELRIRSTDRDTCALEEKVADDTWRTLVVSYATDCQRIKECIERHAHAAGTVEGLGAKAEREGLK